MRGMPADAPLHAQRSESQVSRRERSLKLHQQHSLEKWKSPRHLNILPHPQPEACNRARVARDNH